MKKSILQKTFNYPNISQMLPFSAITNDVIISEVNKSVSIVLEIHISQLDSEEVMEARHQRIISLLNDLPDDTYVSFFYIKTFQRIDIPLVQRSRSRIINFLEEVNNHSLKKRKTPVYQTFLSITIPVYRKSEKDGVLFLRGIHKSDGKDGHSGYRKACERIKGIVRTLSASLGGGIYLLDSSQIIQFLSLLINKEYIHLYSELSSLFKSDFNFSYNGFFEKNRSSYLYYGGYYHTVLSQRTNSRESKLPEKSGVLMNRIFQHRDIKDIPFIIHHTIKVISKQEGLNLAKRRMNMIATRGMLASKLAFLAKTPEGLPPEKLKELVKESIEIIETTNHKFLIQAFNVHLWERSLDKLDELYENFNATISSQYKLKREKYNLKPAFFSMFPGYESINSINTCLASYNAADFMPVDLPRQCYPDKKDKDFIYFHTEEDQLLQYDMFSRAADNWNAMVIGGSGSGKSFLVNNILFQYAVYDPQIAIVDYGGEGAGSYRNFVINQQGTYLEISLDSKNFSINPFDGSLFSEKGELIPQKFSSLMSTLDRMITSRSKDVLTNELRHSLQFELRRYYKERGNNSDNICNLDEFANRYLNKDSTEILYKSLFPFIGEGENAGPYANFFKVSKKIKSKDVVAFDMAGLKGHEELKNVLVPALLDMIATNILGAKGEEHRRKLLIMDEAWQDLKGGSMRDFMEEMFRTVRKLNGQITIITQRFSDILNSEIGEALLANTSFYYLVGNNHDPKPLTQARASSSKGAIQLTEFDIEKIITCQSKRDFYFLTPFFSGLLKFYPTLEFCMLATTDADDKNILRKHMKRLHVEYVTPEVIENALDEFKK